MVSGVAIDRAWHFPLSRAASTDGRASMEHGASSIVTYTVQRGGAAPVERAADSRRQQSTAGDSVQKSF